MELTIQDIIKKPVVTSKSIDLFKSLGQITFEVHMKANKIMVRNAIEKLWEVKVAKVRVINLHGKSKMFSKRSFVTSDKKKAIVTLRKGYKIDLPGLMETTGVGTQAEVAPQKNAEKE